MAGGAGGGDCAADVEQLGLVHDASPRELRTAETAALVSLAAAGATTAVSLGAAVRIALVVGMALRAVCLVTPVHACTALESLGST